MHVVKSNPRDAAVGDGGEVYSCRLALSVDNACGPLHQRDKRPELLHFEAHLLRGGAHLHYISTSLGPKWGPDHLDWLAAFFKLVPNMETTILA